MQPKFSVNGGRGGFLACLAVQKIGKSRNKHSSVVLFKRRVIVPEASRHLFAELRIPTESLNRVIVAWFGF